MKKELEQLVGTVLICIKEQAGNYMNCFNVLFKNPLTDSELALQRDEIERFVYYSLLDYGINSYNRKTEKRFHSDYNTRHIMGKLYSNQPMYEMFKKIRYRLLLCKKGLIISLFLN